MLKNRSIVEKMFLSYMCLLIPLLLVSFSLMRSTIDKMRTDVTTNVTYQLDRVISDFESRYFSYRNSSIHLSNSQELLRHRMLADHVNAAKGIEKLMDFNSYDAISSDVFMYYGDGKLYSAKGLSSLDAYFLITMNYSPESYERAHEIITGGVETLTFLYERKLSSGHLFYHFPIRLYGGVNGDIVSVNYNVSGSILQDMLEPLMQNHMAYIQVIFGEGDSVYYAGNTEDGLSMIRATDYPEDISGSLYTSITAKAPALGVEFIVSYETDKIYQDIYRWRLFNYVLIIVVLLMSIIISFLLSRNHYMHIKNIASTVASAGKSVKDIPTDKRRNEFDYIQTMLKRIVDESNHMEQRIEVSRQALGKQAAMLLFNGLVRDQESIIQMLKVCGIELYESYYAITGITIQEKAAPTEAICRSLEEMFTGNLLTDTTIDEQAALLLLVEMPNPDYLRKNRLETGERISGLLQNNGIKQYRISFSQIYEDITMASYAYLEAVSVLENANEAGIIFWENVTHEAVGSQTFPAEMIQQFEQELKNRNEEALTRCFAQMMQYMEDNSFSNKTRRYLQYSILHTMILAIKENEDEPDTQLMADVIALNQMTGQQFESSVRKLLKRYCHVPDKKDDFENIVAYVNENFSKFDLSLDEVAEYAGLSKYYLSKLFKAKTGSRYIEYLTELRMEEAKRLLVETDEPIRDIVHRVGYYDVPGFRKKFKAIYGINASQFRKNKGRDGAEDMQ